ncbi:MAG: MerR family transcriptional regulator [Leptolyngbya sp. BL-A-14]
MLIGELAQKSGVSKDTIRYYEKLGLLESNRHPQGNNYRQYDAEAPSHLQFIQQGKMMGFTLNEIRTIIHDWKHNRISHTDKIKAVCEKIEQIDRQINQLQAFKQYLFAKLDRLKTEPDSSSPEHC